ncbi:MAG: SDR family oxidoreductase [Phycisphaerae bacterium]
MTANSAHNAEARLPEDFEKSWNAVELDLSDKVAVVTGGGRGIGRTICLALAREGIRAVGVVDVIDEVHTVASDVNQRFGREVFFPYRGDVANSDFRRSVFADLEKRFGVVPICVPAAGITRDRLAVKIDKETGHTDLYPEDEFRKVIEIDLMAPVYWALETVASVARDRRRRGVKRWTPLEGVQGVVVLIGSVSSEGNKGQVSYAAAKAGLEGAEATIASEAAFHGVRCTLVHPGYTDTAMVRTLGDEFIEENILSHTTLHRLIRPEEIAHAVVFLIRNSTVGRQLWADAGWHPAP